MFDQETVPERQYRSYTSGDIEVTSSEPDVLLDIPVLEVASIHLELDALDAHVALLAEVLDLVKLNVGVDAQLGKVVLDIEGVKAQALLKVRLDHVTAIVDRVLTTIDRNPELVKSLSGTVQALGLGAGQALGQVGAAVEEVGKGTHGALDEIGHGTGQAVGVIAEGAGSAVGDGGRSAAQAVADVARGAGPIVGDHDHEQEELDLHGTSLDHDAVRDDAYEQGSGTDEHRVNGTVNAMGTELRSVSGHLMQRGTAAARRATDLAWHHVLRRPDPNLDDQHTEVEIGRGAGQAVGGIAEGAGPAAGDGGRRAAQAVGDVAQGAGHLVGDHDHQQEELDMPDALLDHDDVRDDANEPGEAMGHANRVLDLSKETGNREGAAVALRLIGQIWCASAEWLRALDVLDQSVEMAVGQHDPGSEASARLWLARAHRGAGDRESAVSEVRAGLAAAVLAADRRTEDDLRALAAELDGQPAG